MTDLRADLARFDATNVGFGHSVLRGDFRVGPRVKADGGYGFVAVSRRRVGRPSQRASFPLPVGGIVAPCAKEQMARHDTARVVTPMQDALTFGDWPLCEDISGAMCAHNLSLKGNLPVSEAMGRFGPDATSALSDGVMFEPLCEAPRAGYLHVSEDTP